MRNSKLVYISFGKKFDILFKNFRIKIFSDKNEYNHTYMSHIEFFINISFNECQSYGFYSAGAVSLGF